MPIHFAIDRRHRLVAYVVEGDITPGEPRAFLNAVVAHPSYRCGFDFYGDRRGAPAEPAYFYAIAAEVNSRARQLGPCNWAVVVTDAAGFGMARMWGTLTESSGVRVQPFRCAEDALAWMDLPADYSPGERVRAARRLARRLAL